MFKHLNCINILSILATMLYNIPNVCCWIYPYLQEQVQLFGFSCGYWTLWKKDEPNATPMQTIYGRDCRCRPSLHIVVWAFLERIKMTQS